MRNFVQPGNVLTAIAPTGGVVSGQGVLVEKLFGVAAYTAEAGAEVELSIEGVYRLPKAASAMAQGRAAYWDAAAQQSLLRAAGNSLMGLVAGAAAAPDATVAVRLCPGAAA